MDLYADDQVDDAGEAVAESADTRKGLVLALLDSDGDPMYGDIGKVDRRRKTPGSATAKKNSADGTDGIADNYSDKDNEACSDDDGADGCDAKMTIMRDVTFISGTAFECEADRTLAIECTWDAQGGLADGGTAGGAALLADGTNLDSFLSCTVKE